MAEYIEREAIFKAYAEEQRKSGPWSFETLINSIPAADVAPVRHEKWIHRTTWDKFVCSACSFEQDERSNFCQNCGAKMEDRNHD